ncbi:MAG: cell division protein FtsL [Pseudomonadota bacterium]
MMRGFATTLGTIAVIGLGYWAYHQNIQTKATIQEVDRIQRQIGAERERLEMLQDEWAYLTRPDRLRALADLDFQRLQLMPMQPSQFADLDDIAMPPTADEIAAREAVILLQDSASGAGLRP